MNYLNNNEILRKCIRTNKRRESPNQAFLFRKDTQHRMLQHSVIYRYQLVLFIDFYCAQYSFIGCVCVREYYRNHTDAHLLNTSNLLNRLCNVCLSHTHTDMTRIHLILIKCVPFDLVRWQVKRKMDVGKLLLILCIYVCCWQRMRARWVRQ